MSPVPFTEERSSAMRAALIAEVRGRSPVTRRRHVRMAAIVGASVLLLGVGGLSAAGASGLISWPFIGLDPLPGGQIKEFASPTYTQTGQGDAIVNLGEPPAGATHISVEFTCLSAGTYFWGTDAGGNNPSGSGSCTDADLASPTGTGASYDFPVTEAEPKLYIATDPANRWTLRWLYVNKTDTEWGVNAHGETYGVSKPDGSSPDLIAVVATNGREGYVYADELADADGSTASESFTSPDDAIAWQEAQKGKTIHVPVYESDGTTRVGDFDITYQ